MFPRVPLAPRSVWRESGARAHTHRRPYKKNGVGSTPMWPNWEPGVTSLRFCRAPGRTQRMQPEERQGEMARRSLRPGLTSRPRAEPGSRRGAEPGSQRRPYLYSWAWRQRPAGGVWDRARADSRNERRWLRRATLRSARDEGCEGGRKACSGEADLRCLREPPVPTLVSGKWRRGSGRRFSPPSSSPARGAQPPTLPRF